MVQNHNSKNKPYKNKINATSVKTDLELLTESTRCALLKLSCDDMSILYANDYFFELVGYTRAEYTKLFGLNATSCIHPDDKQALKSSMAKQLELGTYFRFEYRINKKEGEVAWILMNGSSVMDNNLPCYHCSCMDITEMKSLLLDMKDQFEQQMKTENEKHQILSQLSDEIIWEYDIKTSAMKRSGNIQSTFSSHPVIHNYKDTVLSSNVLHAEDKASFIKFCDEMATGKSDIIAELRYKNSQGNYTWYKIQGTTLCTSEGIPSRVIGKTSNIDQSKKNYFYLKEENLKDPLTKLLNKGTTQALVEEMLQHTSSDSTCALLIIDLDDFKPINEVFGHLFGDSVICDVATILSTRFPEDVIGRVAGAEFVVYIPTIISEEDIRQKADELCILVSTLYSGKKLDYPISCSIGIALAKGTNPGYDILYRKADTALYIAKNNGKNCYEIYGVKNDKTTLTPPPITLESQSIKEVQPSYLDSSFVLKAIDILQEQNNPHSSIRTLLSKICLYYDVNHACVVETSLDNKYSMVTHDWCTASPPLLTDCFTPDSMASFKEYATSFQENDVFSCHDISLLEDSSCKIIQEMITTGIKSTLQYALYENNEFCGFIAINDCEKCRLWSNHEINNFLIISKLIGTLLLSLRNNNRNKKMSHPYDGVTGLLSFPQFLEVANSLLMHSHDKNYALIALDIDNFKLYNETYGFSTGNKILNFLSKILLQQIESEELCSRISGDHFILFVTYKDKPHLMTRLNKLKTFFEAKETSLADYYKIHLSLGVYILKSKDKDVTDIIDKANLSRKSVKSLLGTHYHIYTDELLLEENRTRTLESEIEKHLVYGEFIPYFQPKYSLHNDQVIGAEVYARLITPDNKMLLPKDFIPIFEKNGLIINLDFYILEKVCMAIHDWMEASLPVVPISVNISGEHLKTPDFIQRLTSLTYKYNVPPNYLDLEFTEEVLIHNTKSLQSILHQLKDLGFRISMDNTGLEFFSLNELTELSLDKINVDQHIYAKIITPKRKILMTKMIEAAKALDIEVAFTGIETSFQCEISKELGFDSSQGFLYTKPMPLKEFERYVLNHETTY